MKTLLKKHVLAIAGVGIGALAGYLYWHFIGCNTGSCPITSSPVNSTVYGSIMGGLLLSTVKKEEKKEKTDNHDLSGNH